MTKPQLEEAGRAPSRRERVREATLAEIKSIARRHLVGQGASGVSLRAIAREMGMTAPGLYRYVSGIDSLLVLITADMFDELGAAVAAADASVPARDTDRRILTSLRAFRRWALEHPAEFAAMFGPRTRLEPEADPGPAVEAARRFGATFFTLFEQLIREERFELPDGRAVGADLERELRAFARMCGFGDENTPVEAVRVLTSCWVRLYGVVCMEIFQHLDFVMRDMEPLFESELQNVLTGLGVRYESPQSSSTVTMGKSE